MTRVFNCKVVLCGDLAVGKTSVRRNFMGLSFERDHVSTLGADFSLKKVDVGDDRLDLQIWDLGGQKGYEKLRRRYFGGARGALMVFDLTNRESFDNLPYWFSELWHCSGSQNIPVVVLGNKCDLDNFQVQQEEVIGFLKKFKKEHDITELDYQYFSTSAKDGINIEECFSHLSHQVLEDLLNELGLE